MISFGNSSWSLTNYVLPDDHISSRENHGGRRWDRKYKQKQQSDQSRRNGDCDSSDGPAPTPAPRGSVAAAASASTPASRRQAASTSWSASAAGRSEKTAASAGGGSPSRSTSPRSCRRRVSLGREIRPRVEAPPEVVGFHYGTQEAPGRYRLPKEASGWPGNVRVSLVTFFVIEKRSSRLVREDAR